MTTLRDYLNDMLIEYDEQIKQGKDPEQTRLMLIEEYILYVTKRLIGE